MVRVIGAVVMLAAAVAWGGEAAARNEAAGEALKGVRSRLVAEGKVFRAGHPIPIRFLLENVGGEATEISKHPITATMGLEVTDAQGAKVAFLAGPAGVRSQRVPLAAGEAMEVEAFDLAEWFYLRRPGKYAVAIRAETTQPAAGPLSFEVVADPAGTADGDPVGKLLPLLKGREGKWIFVASAGKPRPVRPGKNRKEVAGRSAIFMSPTVKRDGRMVWFWLTEEEAGEVESKETWPPETEGVGKAGRWFVYVNGLEKGKGEWPSIVEDVKRVLGEK